MDEAKALLEKLRSKITRMEKELDNIGQKAKIREDYLKAAESLRGLNIEQVLWEMVEDDPSTFRQLLGLILEPTRVAVHTYRISGSNNFTCDILDFEFTEEFGGLQSVQDGNRTIDRATTGKNSRRTFICGIGAGDREPFSLGH